jgi:hypothetical protein
VRALAANGRDLRPVDLLETYDVAAHPVMSPSSPVGSLSVSRLRPATLPHDLGLAASPGRVVTAQDGRDSAHDSCIRHEAAPLPDHNRGDRESHVVHQTGGQQEARQGRCTPVGVNHSACIRC